MHADKMHTDEMHADMHTANDATRKLQLYHITAEHYDYVTDYLKDFSTLVRVYTLVEYYLVRLYFTVVKRLALFMFPWFSYTLISFLFMCVCACVLVHFI